MTALRFASKGNRDPYRQGYQYTQRNPAPIVQERPSVWARLKGLGK